MFSENALINNLTPAMTLRMISSITNLSRGGIGRLVLAPETGLELDGGLAEPTVGAGQGSTSGGTKKVIVEQLGTT